MSIKEAVRAELEYRFWDAHRLYYECCDDAFTDDNIYIRLARAKLFVIDPEIPWRRWPEVVKYGTLPVVPVPDNKKIIEWVLRAREYMNIDITVPLADTIITNIGFGVIVTAVSNAFFIIETHERIIPTPQETFTTTKYLSDENAYSYLYKMLYSYYLSEHEDDFSDYNALICEKYPVKIVQKPVRRPVDNKIVEAYVHSLLVNNQLREVIR